MRFTIQHHTWYRYDVAVRLAPHRIRLLPRLDQGQLLFERLQIDPVPQSRQEVSDPLGNRCLLVEFSGACRELQITSEFELITAPRQDATPHLAALPKLPWSPVTSLHSSPLDPSVETFAANLAQQVGHAPLAFLDSLARTLHQRTQIEVRTAGEALPAAVTLQSGRGACRDLTVLFLECARSLGISGHFVSGYQCHPQPSGAPQFMHAWPEVLLPGGGFYGWDPTLGERLGDEYIALYSAPTQAETMPVDGGFYFDGPVVNSTLDFTLRVDRQP